MSLYSDLTEVLTPYANKIKRLNGGIDTSNMTEDMRDLLRQLGLKNQLINSADVYTFSNADNGFYPFDPENLNVSVNDGHITTKDKDRTYKTALFFDEDVDTIEYTISSGNITCQPILTEPFEMDKSGTTVLGFHYLPISRNGWTGLYRVFADNWSSQSIAAGKKWNPEVRVKHIRITRHSNSFTFLFTHTDNTTSEQTISESYMGAVGHWPKRLGLYLTKQFANQSGDHASNIKISAATKFITEVSASGSPLYGETWDAWGDSITAGAQSYHYYVAQETGCVVNNYGVSGDTVSQVYNRYNNNENASGVYITIFAGVNDYNNSTPIETFRTNVSNFLNAVVAKDSIAKFGWIAPLQIVNMSANSAGATLEDYVNVIIEECRKKSVPVLDLFHEGNWYGFNSAFTAAYANGGIHPNATGHALLAKKIRKFLESL